MLILYCVLTALTSAGIPYSQTDAASPPALSVTESYQHTTRLHDEVDASILNLEELRIRVNDDFFLAEQFAADLCPHLQTCIGNNTQGSNDTMWNPWKNCCVPCDCTDECYAIGNCCPQKLRAEKQVANRSMSSYGEICVNTAIIRATASTLMKNEWKKNTDAFMLIKSCPSKTTVNDVNETLVGKCTNPSLMNEDESTPVSDEITNLHYANIYCAMCNSVDSHVSSWLGFLSCEHVTLTHSLFRDDVYANPNIMDTILKQLPLGCYITWRPSKPQSQCRSCFIEKDMISECTDLSNSKLQSLCKEITFPMIFEKSVYKNVYCFACSNIRMTYAMCQMPELPSVPFTALIQANILSRDNADHTDDVGRYVARCSRGGTYVKLLDQCLDVGCGLSMLDINGSCIPVLGFVIGRSFDYRLKIIYDVLDDGTLILPVWQDVLDDAWLVVFGDKYFYLDGICNELVLDTWLFDGKVIYRVQLTRKIDSVLTNVQDSYTEFKKRIKNVSYFSRGGRQFKAEFDESGLSAMPQKKVYHASFAETNMFCQSSIAMTELQFCKTITLQYGSYVINVGKEELHTNEGGARFNPSEYIIRMSDDEFSETVQICLDTYVSRMLEAKDTNAIGGLRARELVLLATILANTVHTVLY